MIVMCRYFLRDRKETRQNDSFRDTYAHRHTLFPCVSFLKRTCSHAIPYKKTDVVRNVLLETRYTYVCAAQIRRVTHIHMYALTHAYRADRSVRTKKEKRTIIPRVLRAAVLEKMENGRSVKGVPVLVDSAPVQSRTLKNFTTFYWERMKDEE